MLKKRWIPLAAAVITTGALATTVAAASGNSRTAPTPKASMHSAANPYGLITPGTATVIIPTSDMPYAGETASGQMTGLEGQLFKVAAKQLHLKVKYSLAEFTSVLAGIQSDRWDIAIGGVAWSKTRSQTGVMTDPVFYSPIVDLARPGVVAHNIAQLKKYNVGGLSSTTGDDALASVPGLKLHSYPSVTTALADLAAGRIDALVLDPLILSYARKTIGGLKHDSINVIAPPSATQLKQNPALSGLAPYMVVWYCAKQAAGLCNGLNKVIDGWYHSGVSLKVLKQWGVGANFLVAPPATVAMRRGVDRPKDWRAPTRPLSG